MTRQHVQSYKHVNTVETVIGLYFRGQLFLEIQSIWGWHNKGRNSLNALLLWSPYKATVVPAFLIVCG